MGGKITFHTGSFMGEISTDALGNLHINTHENSSSIFIGGLQELSGSSLKTLDKETGKVIEEKKRLPDGKVERTKFDPTKPGEFVIDQKLKVPEEGIEFIRSGSSSDNQIMMQQNSTGAYITVSGSTPGFNILSTSPTPNLVRLMRADKDSFIGNVGWSQGIAQSNYGGVEQDDWYYSRYHLGASDNSNILILKYDTGNVEIPNGDLVIREGNLNVGSGSITAKQYILSSSVTAMTTSFSSGSTIFGDSSTDTHQFTGSLYVTEDLYTDVIRRNTSNPTKVNVKLNSAGVDIHTDHATKRKAHFGSTSSVTGSFNVSQNLTVGKDLTGVRSASITYITASTVDVDGDTIRIGGEAITKNDWKNIKEGKFSSVAGTGDITLSGSLIPSVNASKTGGFSLGSKSNRWSKLYVASTIDVSGSSLIISPSASIAAGDDFNVIISGSVIPANTGSDSLGSLAKPFKDIYVTTGSMIFVKRGVKQDSITYEDIKRLRTGKPLRKTDDEADSDRVRAKLTGGAEITGSLYFNGTQVTATSAELNILDGVTATTTELNKMDGVTVSTANINSVTSKLDVTGGTLSGALGNRVGQFGDGDDTPSVKTGNIFKTKNSKSLKITSFDDGVEGQVINIIFGDGNTLLVHGGTQKKGFISLSGGKDWTGAATDTIQLIFDGTYWYEVCRSDNTK